ncbi:hypothetical protein F511_37615 [Dorcoceras hygrometricum]|uniref:Uncharacterized protein n=1 Tax=Dorcoceras hygrometricum TaxID=472368 RepID=A0A2Z7CVC5_9LAMI|nr:hypothetical protein F511_37615 [Dorcoceras hygrometricum]
MDQVDKKVTLGFLTRRIEPSWLRTNQLEVKDDQPGADKPASRMITVRSLISQMYQPARNEANLEPRSSSRAGKNRTSSAADKKRHRCKVAQEQIKEKSNQLDEDAS